MNELRPVSAPIARNPGTPLTPDWFEDVQVNPLRRRAPCGEPARTPVGQEELPGRLVVKALQCIDLTHARG